MSKNVLKLTATCLALAGAAIVPLQANAQSNDAVVTRDAATGQLRAATAEEMANLDKIKQHKARMFRVAPKQLMGRIHVSGGRGARLTDDTMSASVAVIGKDGKLEQECFDTAAEAETALASGSLTHSHANLKPVLE